MPRRREMEGEPMKCKVGRDGKGREGKGGKKKQGGVPDYLLITEYER
jgi:hypothetical protein